MLLRHGAFVGFVGCSPAPFRKSRGWFSGFTGASAWGFSGLKPNNPASSTKHRVTSVLPT